MTPGELVERVAEALAKEQRFFWPDFTKEEKDVIRGEARAAIAVVLDEAALMLWSNGDFDQSAAVRALTPAASPAAPPRS